MIPHVTVRSPRHPWAAAGPGRASRRRAERSSRRGRLAGGPPPTGAESSPARNNSARAAAPVTGRCTRYGALHPIRRGALPTDRVQHTQSQEQTRNLRDASQAAAPVGGGRAWPGFETTRRAEGSRRGRRAGGPPPTGAQSSPARNNSARATAPVTGRNTRSEGVHCLRIGCSTPNHKNKRGICETRAWLRCPWAAAGPGRTTSRRAERSSRRGRLAGGPTPTGASSSTALSRSSAAAQHTAISRHSTSHRRGHPRR